MDLANHQRILLGLIRSNHRVVPFDDPYFERVSRSKDLDEARGNIYLWRVWVLERTCVLTVTLLKQLDLLKTELDAFIAKYNISPFRESQGPDFLETVSSHENSLIASVAQFELALLKVRQGDPGSFVVAWSVEPHTILNCLAKNIPIETNISSGDYEIRISNDLPSLFQIDKIIAGPADVS